MRSHVVDWLDGFLPHHLSALLAPSWFTCVGLAGLVTLLWMLRVGRRQGIDSGVIASLILWPYVAAVVGGIIVPMTIDGIQQLIATGRVRIHWAGMTSFWGYLCGLGALVIVCRRNTMSVGRLGDLAAAPLAISLTLARIGCFLAGCDYGKVTSVPWAVRFPSGSPAWQDHVNSGLIPVDRTSSLAVHPTQLYEALLGLAILALVLVVSRTRWARAAHGRVALAAITLYSVGRIGVEALRGDSGRGIYAGLSSGQIFSLVVLCAIAAGVFLTRRRLVHAIASAAVLVALADPHAAEAQPVRPGAPAPTMPAPAAPAPTAPAPAAEPAAMPAVNPGAPAPMAPGPAMRAPEEPESRSGMRFQGGVMLGVATPINRHPDQVALLAGPTVSLGLVFQSVGLWFDFDSMGNRDASHGTAMISGSVGNRIRDNLMIGGRFGIGATLVNFDEPAFRDVTGTTLRVEAIVEYSFGESWALWIRPFTFDVLTARDLGGPITTYQMRLGLGYRFGGGSAPRPTPATRPPMPPPQPYPPQYPPQPYPPQPYPPQPYPPQPYPPQPYPPQPYPPQTQPVPGAERGVCRPNNSCDPGLTCASNRCVNLPR